MKKLLFLFAALLQTALVMASNPTEPQTPQQKFLRKDQQAYLKNTMPPAQKVIRAWLIIADQEEVLRPDRVPAPAGAKTPLPRNFEKQK